MKTKRIIIAFLAIVANVWVNAQTWTPNTNLLTDAISRTGTITLNSPTTTNILSLSNASISSSNYLTGMYVGGTGPSYILTPLQLSFTNTQYQGPTKSTTISSGLININTTNTNSTLFSCGTTGTSSFKIDGLGNTTIGTPKYLSSLTVNGTITNSGNITNNGILNNTGDATFGTPSAKKTLTTNGSIVANRYVLSNDNSTTLASGCWSAQPFYMMGAIGTTDQNDFYIGQTNNVGSPYTYLQSQGHHYGNPLPIYLNPAGGGVAVGTTNTQGYAFAVNGGILAEEVKVITDVPQSDYVFEPDYKLRSLNEVQTFVTTNKHLPEVPSAAEFKRDGYKVGQMDDLLLRKVEELTLYLFAQQKEIEALKAELKMVKQ